MALKSNTVYIIPHTHWDREWYLSFDRFRYRLLDGTRAILGALKAGKLPSFFFDGQTVILEDLEEVMEKDEYITLQKEIREGRIEVGPWYVLPDEFSVSGESLVRNLQTGLEIAEKAGSWCKLGYLPDTFGHAGQLPHIFRSLGLEAALLFRGTKTKGTLVSWIGADGQTLPALILPLFDGYYHSWFNEDNYLEQAGKFIEEMKPFRQDGQILLPAGADHMIPVDNFADRVDELNNRISDSNFIISTFESYLHKILQTEPGETIRGEQRDPSRAYILSGILSARYDLKLLNCRAENLLTGYVEPFSFFDSSPSPAFEKRMWKTLIKNHAHDSIGGCSIDMVHRHNRQRFEAVLEGAGEYLKDRMERLCSCNPGGFNNKVHVFTMNPAEYGDRVAEAELFIPEDADKGTVSLEEDSCPLKIDVLSRIKSDGFYSRNDRAPGWTPGFLYRVLFLRPVFGMAHSELTMVPEETRVLTGPLILADDSLENSFLRVRGNSRGGLTITDKNTGRVWEDMNGITASLDAGDSYTYAPPVENFISRAIWTGRMEKRKGNLFEELILSGSLHGPTALDDSQSQSSPVTLKLRLNQNDPVLYCRLELENRFRDRIFTLDFPYQSDSAVSFGDSAFDLVRREKIWQNPLCTSPMCEASEADLTSRSAIHAGGLSLLHQGIHSYRILDRGGDQKLLSCTLMRSFGYLSRRDISSRGGGAGPDIATPEGQLPGLRSWEYGLTFGVPEEAPGAARALFAPPIVQQGGTYMGQNLPPLILNGDYLTVTAVKQITHEKGSFILRFFNPSEKPVKFGVPGYRLEELDLRESSGKPLADKSVPAKGILTVKAVTE